MISFILILLFAILPIQSFAGDPSDSGGGSGGPSIQREEAIIETIDLNGLYHALRPMTAVKAKADSRILDMTKGNVVYKPKRATAVHVRLREAKSIDEIISALDKYNSIMEVQEKKPVQLLVPLRGVESMRIDGNYFAPSDLGNAKEVLIDNSREYEIYFKSGEMLDLLKKDETKK